jgi:glycosyltransferase involved in cell wall biosynthesis
MKQLRVCIVGGIYDRSEEYRKKRCLTPETILAQGLRSRGIEVVESGHRRFAPSGKFDLVHVHHLGKAALVMASAPPGARFVFTSHDPRLMNGYQVTWRRLASYRFVAGRADGIVVLSEAERQFASASVPRSAGRIVTIANGFSSDVFSYGPPRGEGPPLAPGHGRPYRLLFVGQLIPMKGVDVLLRAAALLGPNTKFELQLVYQNSGLELTYRELAARLGIADRVQFLGLRSADELAALYRAADLFVLASHGEALPAVITEAMMCGLPVVATRVGGVPDQVGPHGYLVEPGDPAALAATIRQALGAIDEGRVSRAEISRWTSARYSARAMVDEHLALYSRLLAAATPPARCRSRFQAVNLGASLLLNVLGQRLAGRGLLTG